MGRSDVNSALVLFLPSADDGDYRWLRVADDAITARGEGLPEIPDAELDDTRLVAIAPADGVTLHWANLPDRSIAQAVAAARIVVTEASAAPIADLHVAVGHEGIDHERPIGVVAAAQMRAWLAALAENGIDPEAMLPAPMLLPRPEEGFVRADLGGQGVVRGPTSGFADEARLTELITGNDAPVVLGRDELEAAIIASVAAPTLNLRQGPFAKRRRVAIDWALIRRLAWLAVAILSVTLLISLMQIAKYSFAADGLEARADLLARDGLPRGMTVTDPDRQLDERLAGVRGGGLGFSRSAAAVFSAVQSVPGSEVTALSFAENGELRVSIAAQGEAQVNDLRSRIQAYGFTVEQVGGLQSSPGRLTGQFVVTP